MRVGSDKWEIVNEFLLELFFLPLRVISEDESEIGWNVIRVENESLHDKFKFLKGAGAKPHKMYGFIIKTYAGCTTQTQTSTLVRKGSIW